MDMDMKGKALMEEFEENQENGFFQMTTDQEPDYYANAAKCYISSANSMRVGSFPKPVALPPPPRHVLNPATTLFLFEKELKSSDVSHARRIVIPKAHAVKYLPCLTDGDGIFIYMDDVDHPCVWVFRFRYWQNNNSRMFVFEKTGDFVKAYGLRAGDKILIYQDELTGRYGIQAEIKSKQITLEACENVSKSYHGSSGQGDEMGTYFYPANNMNNFMGNFVNMSELAVPDSGPSMNFDPVGFYPYYYF